MYGIDIHQQSIQQYAITSELHFNNNLHPERYNMSDIRCISAHHINMYMNTYSFFPS